MNMCKSLKQAVWICGPAFEYGEDDAGYYSREYRNHVVSRTFELAGTRSVRLAIAVLGYAQVRVNGRPLEWNGKCVELLGHWTNYTKAVLYDEFDISAMVHAGENELHIELGNGFYNPAPLTLFGKYNLRERLAEVGTPAVLAAVTQGECTVLATDASWHCEAGRLLFNNVYLGEVADLRPREPQELALNVRANRRTLEPNPVPLCARVGEVPATRVEERGDGLLLDFGEMVEGFIDIAFDAHVDDEVELTYAEILDGQGEPVLDPNLAGLVGREMPFGICPGGPGAPSPAAQRDVLLCTEGVNLYANTFTYHSFRYVMVCGLQPEALREAKAVYVHNDVRRAGTFACDSDDFTRLLAAAERTKLNNLHDVFEDCSRERFGYGGDMVALATSNLFCFDEQGLLDKTLADFRRDQTERGGLPETVPFMGIGSNGPAYGEGPLLWQLAYPYLAAKVHQYYGRRDLLEREWPGIKRFADYLLSFDPAELAGHCLGDHGSVLTAGNFKSGTPDKEFTGWCAILWSLRCISEVASRLGERVPAYIEAEEDLRTQIGDRFACADGSFGDGTQTACAFAGMLGLGDPARCAELLAEDFERRGDVLTTGIFGTMLAFELLVRCGHNDIVERWLLRREHPSLLSMLDADSGALAEGFSEQFSSFNHAMFSSYAQWFYQGLAGIRVQDDAVGCDRVRIEPCFSRNVNHVTCSYRTPHGVIAVAWERKASGVLAVNIKVPERICASVCVSGARWSRDATLVDGVRQWVGELAL